MPWTHPTGNTPKMAETSLLVLYSFMKTPPIAQLTRSSDHLGNASRKVNIVRRCHAIFLVTEEHTQSEVFHVGEWDAVWRMRSLSGSCNTFVAVQLSFAAILSGDAQVEVNRRATNKHVFSVTCQHLILSTWIVLKCTMTRIWKYVLISHRALVTFDVCISIILIIDMIRLNMCKCWSRGVWQLGWL